jgi:acetyltransferase-like isoleucine patch superfamily enzyme
MGNIFFDRKDLKYCGENVIIGKTVRIRKPQEVSIGDNTIIDDFCYISCGITIGKNCHIASNVTISGGKGHFYMGDYSTISNHCSLHCASSDYGEMSLDLPSVPENIQYGGEVGDIKIGNFVTIGAHSCLLPKTEIPDGVSCGAYSLLKSIEYSPYSLYAGIPAKFIKNRTGREKLIGRINGII